MQRFWQITLPLAEVDPSVMDNVDLDFMIREHAESVGTPAGMIRPEDQVKERRATRDAQQKQLQQQQANESAGKTASGFAPLVKSAQGAKGGGGAGIAPLVAALGQQKEGTIPQGQPVLTRG